LICVVDASVVLKWFLPEPDSAAADFLLEKFLNDEVELVAPDLILVEAASALWKRVVVRKELSADEATRRTEHNYKHAVSHSLGRRVAA
jgi:predicted nucleic acid-binding protein